MRTHGIPLSSQVPLPHEITWLKAFAQNIFMVKKMLPFSHFTRPSKSPPKDSLTSSNDLDMLPLIVMSSTKNKSSLKFALTTCLISTEPIWKTLILFSLLSCSKKLVRQQYQSSLHQLKNPSQKRKVFLKLSQTPAMNQWLERSENKRRKNQKSTLPYHAPMKK